MERIEEIITLNHGAGGMAMHDLIRKFFLSELGNPVLLREDDSGVLEKEASGRIALTTDAYVVSPLFFPGGDIGRLAVCGAVNDLACVAARPICVTASFILEEGFRIETLRQIVRSMRIAADEADVFVAAGDTKVVQKGAADGVFISTCGLGLVETRSDGEPWNLSGANAKPGDAVIISGTIGDHGIAVMNAREGFGFSSDIVSDCAPLWGMVENLLKSGADIHALRDPTRGGLASALNEIAAQSGVCIEINEASVPVREPVRAACEILGLDPLHVANEGIMVVMAAGDSSEIALKILRASPYGRDATLIGKVLDGPVGRVHVRTPYGSRRILLMPHGEQLPRIC